MGMQPSNRVADTEAAANNGTFNFDMTETVDGQLPWQLGFEMPSEGRGPVLTTSGALANTGDDSTNQYNLPALQRADFSQIPEADYLSPNGSGIPSLPSYAEEFPLFSLMTEFDQLGDPFSMVNG